MRWLAKINPTKWIRAVRRAPFAEIPIPERIVSFQADRLTPSELITPLQSSSSSNIDGGFFAIERNERYRIDPMYHVFASDQARARWIADCETTVLREQWPFQSPSPPAGRYECEEPDPSIPVYQHGLGRHLDGISVHPVGGIWSTIQIPICQCISPPTVTAWALWISKIGIRGIRPLWRLGLPRKRWVQGEFVSAEDMNRLEGMVKDYRIYAILGIVGFMLNVLWRVIETLVTR